MNPASARINNLLGKFLSPSFHFIVRYDIEHFLSIILKILSGAPMPSKARRGSIDTNPATLLLNKKLNLDRSPSPSLNKKTGSKSKLFNKLLSIGKSSDKLDAMENNETTPQDMPSPVFDKMPRRGRRASDGGVMANIQAALNVSKQASKNALETLEEGSGR